MLNSITRIERFMVDSLSTSNLIPLGVQILRLADEIDKEGVLSRANSIVVRYSGSSIQVKHKNPLVYEKNMDFTVEFYCQSYLSDSGHDFATHLLSATSKILSNQVPMGTGHQIVDPFNLSSERFEGLTENSQYKYSQQWNLTAEETFQPFALDPCVLRGNCEAVWPPFGVKTERKPWEVVPPESNGIYAPVNSEGELEPLVISPDGSLSFRDSGEVFCENEDWKGWVFKPGFLDGSSDSSLVSVVILGEEGEIVREHIYLPTGNLLPKLSVPEAGFQVDIFTGSPLYEVNYKTKAVSDPMSVSPMTSVLYPGRLLEVKETVRLEVEGVVYTLVTKGSPRETPWVRLNDITYIQNNDRPGSECYEGATIK